MAKRRRLGTARELSARHRWVLDPNAGPVLGDSGRLQQVVWNLLTNAIKFTSKGGRVQIELQRVNSHLEIRVQDSGQGIKAEFLPYVFDRFRQADPGTNRRFGGLGLGLSIVKHLVELHGGSVEAKSQGEGQGAVFIVHLPIQTLHSEKEEDKQLLANQLTLRGIRVLVVDDEPDARELINRFLREYEAEIHVASSVTEALEVFRRVRPDVLLSDIGMPEQDGYELIRAVRSLSTEEGGSTPAVALTALARAEDRKRAMLAGYQAHVTKPVDPGELVAVVATLTGRTGR